MSRFYTCQHCRGCVSDLDDHDCPGIYEPDWDDLMERERDRDKCFFPE